MTENESLNVNAETLELLQSRLESKVRTSFFRSVTLPIGGGGVLGLLAAVFWWVPAQVQDILGQESVQKEIHEKIQLSVERFFDQEGTQADLARRIQAQVNVNLQEKLPELVDRSVRGEVESYFAGGRGREDVRRFFESQEGRVAMADNIELAVREFMSSPVGSETVNASIKGNVTEFFEGDEGIQLVGRAVPGAVSAHFETGQMNEDIEVLVNEFLEGDGKAVLIDAVNERLKPAAERTSQAIKQNADQLVESLLEKDADEEDSMHLVARSKGAPPAVTEMDTLRQRGKPVVLTLNLRSPFLYNRPAIQAHLDTFRRELGGLFRFVAVLHGTDEGTRLVALLDPDDFEARLHADDLGLVSWLNDRRISFEGARDWASEHLGSASVLAVDWSRSLVEVLTDTELWSDWQDLDAERAVVDAGQRLVAATSRRRLIEGLLDV